MTTYTESELAHMEALDKAKQHSNLPEAQKRLLRELRGSQRRVSNPTKLRDILLERIASDMGIVRELERELNEKTQ